MIRNKCIKLLAIVLGSFIVCVPSGYATLYKLNEEQKIRVNISKYGLNRITMPPYEIKQVTGDDNRYKLKYDPDGRNVYLAPLVKVDDVIEISLKNSIGVVQDMELVVQNIKGQTITIDSRNTDMVGRLVLDTDDNAKKMMQHMHQNIVGKFYVRDSNINIPNPFGLNIRQIKFYKYDHLEGAVLLVTNKGKSILMINLNDISKLFKGSLLALIKDGDSKLLPGQSKYVFIVCGAWE